MRGSTQPPDSAAPEGSPAAEPPIHFALPQLLPPPSRAFGLGGTIGAHIAVGLLLLFIDSLPTPEPPPLQVSLNTHTVTTLTMPAPSRPLTLPELMSRTPPAPQSPAPVAPKPVLPKFVAPAKRPGAPAPELITEPPPLPAAGQPLPQETIFTRNTPTPVAPPAIQPSEQTARATPQQQPKLAFETPSAQIPTGAPGGKIPLPPRTGVDELGRAMARPSSGGGIVVGDAIDSGAASIGGAASSPATIHNQSAVQLLTADTMGVDFKPYLVTVLAAVRRNWLAILPESARMGRRGRVQVQFAISRDGSVPKLVISAGSGAEALDRAAVAGISASNPFPPLPSEFQGPQIRLQFTFAYNMQ